MDPIDRDLMIRTVIGEAGNQGEQGMAGVAHVIMNRTQKPSAYGGSTPGQVVMAKSQFEPWATRSGELFAIDPNSPKYQAAARIVDGVANGAIPDPTNGATHFANVQVVKDRNGGTVGNHGWLNSAPTATIGAHTFFAPQGPVKPTGAGVQMPPGTTGVPNPVAASPVAPSASDAMASPAPVQQGILGKLLVGADAKPGSDGWQGQPIIPYVMRQVLSGARGSLSNMTKPDAASAPTPVPASQDATSTPPTTSGEDFSDFPAPQVGLTADGLMKQFDQWDRSRGLRPSATPSLPPAAAGQQASANPLASLFNVLA